MGNDHVENSVGMPRRTDTPRTPLSDSISSSLATTAPVRACTTLETDVASCTYASTCSTWSAPGATTIPSNGWGSETPLGVTKVRSTTASVLVGL